MAEISGTQVTLKVGGTAVGSQSNVTFTESIDPIDVSSKEARARKLIGGRYSSSVSLDSLYVPDDTALATLKTAIRSDGAVTLIRTIDGASFETADGIATGLTEAFPDQAPATLAVTVEITGSWAAV